MSAVESPTRSPFEYPCPFLLDVIETAVTIPEVTVTIPVALDPAPVIANKFTLV